MWERGSSGFCGGGISWGIIPLVWEGAIEWTYVVHICEGERDECWFGVGHACGTGAAVRIRGLLAWSRINKWSSFLQRKDRAPYPSCVVMYSQDIGRRPLAKAVRMNSECEYDIGAHDSRLEFVKDARNHECTIRSYCTLSTIQF